jgi:endonuclease/exonuclease/phosphatase family metal-dependent hydrolase
LPENIPRADRIAGWYGPGRMRSVVVKAMLILTAVALCACPIGRPRDRDDDEDDEDDPVDAGTGFPSPRTDLTEKLGGDGTLEIAAWNVKNFPCGNPSFSTECRDNPEETPELLADLIASMDIDLLAVEEIADEDAFNETVQRLPEHESVLSTHTYGDGSYQKIGYIYRASVLEAGAPTLLFNNDGDFPRPALQVEFTWTGGGQSLSFLAIAVHLKAGENPEDRDRREAAIAQMEQFASNLVDGSGNNNIIMLGDFNETLDGDGFTSFAPLRDTSRYRIRTQANANSGESSFIPSGVILDHIVTTTALDPFVGETTTRAIIPRLDVDVSSYRDRLSDHLPVVLVLQNP